MFKDRINQIISAVEEPKQLKDDRQMLIDAKSRASTRPSGRSGVIINGERYRVTEDGSTITVAPTKTV